MHATRKSGYPSRQTLYQWLNEWVAYFATVFRLTWSTRAISDLERPAAFIDRILFTVSRGTVISSILPGRARQSNRPGKPYGEGRAPGPRGAALLLKLLNFSCSRCLFPSDHSDHFLVNINRDPSYTDLPSLAPLPELSALVWSIHSCGASGDNRGHGKNLIHR